MNLPNFLTILRFFLALLFLYLMFLGQGQWVAAAFSVFLLASLTDYWDGRLARSRNQVTYFGKLMDPIADKTLTACAFGSFYFLRLLPGFLVLLVIGRDLIVTWHRLALLQSGQEPLVSRESGKHKTFLQMVYICFVLCYLIFKNTSFWNAVWDPFVFQVIYWGMLAILLLTLWSGLRIFKARLPALKAMAGLGFLGTLPWPGAWGSLAGIILCWFLPAQHLLLATILVSFFAIFLCKPVVATSGIYDPQWFILDEVCGMTLSVLWVPKTVGLYLVGYALFRFFDVLKPWPIYKLEKNTGDEGIVWDDLAAGAVTALILFIYLRVTAGAAG